MDNEQIFKKLEDDGLLVNCLSSLGWAFWPYKEDGTGIGYFDEHLLRKLADEIERRNKPFWDEYNAHCEREAEHYCEEVEEAICFPTK